MEGKPKEKNRKTYWTQTLKDIMKDLTGEKQENRKDYKVKRLSQTLSAKERTQFKSNWAKSEKPLQQYQVALKSEVSTWN